MLIHRPCINQYFFSIILWKVDKEENYQRLHKALLHRMLPWLHQIILLSFLFRCAGHWKVEILWRGILLLCLFRIFRYVVQQNLQHFLMDILWIYVFRHCRFISGPHFPVFGLNAEIYGINLRIQSEYRKIRTRNNSLFGHFSRSDYLDLKYLGWDQKERI